MVHVIWWIEWEVMGCIGKCEGRRFGTGHHRNEYYIKYLAATTATFLFFTLHYHHDDTFLHISSPSSLFQLSPVYRPVASSNHYVLDVWQVPKDGVTVSVALLTCTVAWTQHWNHIFFFSVNHTETPCTPSYFLHFFFSHTFSFMQMGCIHRKVFFRLIFVHTQSPLNTKNQRNAMIWVICAYITWKAASLISQMLRL